MTRDDLVAHCAALPGAWLDERWDGDVVVKVGSKIFAFVGSPAPAGADPVAGGSVGVKCGRTREEADEWLHRYPDDAGAMAYIGRFGWNTLRFGGLVSDDEVLEAVDSSYAAIVAKLPRRERPEAETEPA